MPWWRYETKDERLLRLKLQDASKGVSALLYVRIYTKETAKRRELTQEALRLARDALGLDGNVPRRLITKHRKQFVARKEKVVKQREQLLETK